MTFDFKSRFFWLAAASLGTVVAAPTAWAQMDVVVAPLVCKVGPPSAIAEQHAVCPSPNHVYLEGHWSWSGDKHVWTPGQWAVPPGAGYKWVPARYAEKKHKWEYFAGYWRPTAGPAEVVAAQPVREMNVVETAPPKEIVEVVSPPASPSVFWVKGNWYWSGTEWQWAAGHWDHTHPEFVWEDAFWKVKSKTSWVFVPGRWRHV